MRASPEFQAGLARLRQETHALLDKLRLSAPFASMRYQGHMLWDQALPAIIGHVRRPLYNQNNVAAEASPVTTRLEIEAGNDLCRMLGYDVPEPGRARRQAPSSPWGHITSGGTVANIEALWAARNLKFAGVALPRRDPRGAPARAGAQRSKSRSGAAARRGCRPRHLDAAEPRPRRARRPAGRAGWRWHRRRSERYASAGAATRCRTSG